jgi:hypothetical protein
LFPLILSSVYPFRAPSHLCNHPNGSPLFNI